VDSGMKLQRVCAEALVELCDAARQAGHELYLKSAYRSYGTQDTMYYNRLKKNGYDDGWVTKPGASDHQTGLGCDVVPKKWTDRGMNEDMAREEETQWMAANCARFGFIHRYQTGKETITGISAESWHFRYVGVPHAYYMTQNDLCLEEYLAALEKCTYGGNHLFVDVDGKSYEIYYVPAVNGATTTIPVPGDPSIYTVSGNNYSGFIVTIER
jgi:hypothetical protein